MAYDLAKVTANGNNLIAQILANRSSLSIDKIEISDTQLSSTTDISTMTSVPKVVQTVSANGFSKNSNTLIISTVVDNSSISADYKAWVFGIWGSDSQNGQSQLIAVITSTNSPDTIPAFSGSTPVSYTYKFNIGFSNASQIQFNMIDDSFATNDTVVHTTGDETIDGQKKFKTDPTDGAGNAYAKTVDVNQQLGKKVNIADMRKPANDVAGIEEVNTKQDKIGYTPADDSKVVHNSGDETIGGTKTFTNPIKGTIDGITYRYSAQGDDLDTSYMNDSVIFVGTNKVANAPAGTSGTWAIVRNYNSNATNGAQSYYDTNQGVLYVRTRNSNTTYTQWIQLADDSKVAHLSGANNFDTVPTVNNNPLLLASSLPPDLARLSQDANFTEKLQQNGQDVALASNTIARNPNTGTVSEINTFTAAQTFSIAPVINDASTSKGDNQAATMADLKSLENSAWRQLTGSSEFFSSYKALIKIDTGSKSCQMILSGVFSGASLSHDSGHRTLIDFSDVFNGISNLSSSQVINGVSGLTGQEYRIVLSTSGNSIITKDGMAIIGDSGEQSIVYSDSGLAVTFKYNSLV